MTYEDAWQSLKNQLIAHIAEVEENGNTTEYGCALHEILGIIDCLEYQMEHERRRLYIKIYADLSPEDKAEKMYQICEDYELKEVIANLKEYADLEDDE